MIPVIKKLLFFLPLIFYGCIKVDTDAQEAFCHVQKEIFCLTGKTVYWDPCIEDSFATTSLEQLLENELTEDLAIQIALLNNQQLQSTYESLGIAKAQLAQAGLLKNPIFLFAYRFSTSPSVTDVIDINLFQNFLEILLLPLKKRMAQAELEATQAIVTTEILNVIAETKIAFYTLQATRQICALKKEVLLAAELSYEAARRLFAAGNIKDLDVSMERSVYEQLKLEVASLEIKVLEAREKLNILMGLWGHQIEWKVPLSLPLIPVEEGKFTCIENEAIASSIDLKIAYQRLLTTAAGFGIDTTRLVFPQLDIGISGEREESVWYVGPAFSLSLPLFDIGKVNSAKARAKIMQEWNQYTALAIDIRSKARSSRFCLLNAFRQSRYLEEIVVPLAKQITHLTLLQHNAMQLGVFHLLAAKRDELEKKIQSVHAQREYWHAKVRIHTLLSGHVLRKHIYETPLRKYDE